MARCGQDQRWARWRAKMSTIESWLLRFAPWLLAGSLVLHLARQGLPHDLPMVDLRVYRDASPNVFTGHLLDFTYEEFTPGFPLPFTYPPFAALLFLPLSLVPWAACRWLWQALSVFCLWWMVRGSLRLVVGAGHDGTWRRRTLLWTGLAMWAEPVRTTLRFGQINLVLVACLLAAMVAARSGVAGLGVGVLAGIKLTPAISGLYFLASRRFAAAAWSAAGFVLTLGLGYLVAPRESTRFWFHLLGVASRVGPVGSAINQSLRGALSRTVGYDVGSGPIWLVSVAAVGVLAGLALWAAVRAGEPLAALVVVEFLGLLVSPISWSHHWVWVVPAVIWMVHRRAGRPWPLLASAVAWVLAVGSPIILRLIAAQPSIWVIPRPGYLSALGWVYPALGVFTLGAVAVSLWSTRPEVSSVPPPPRRSPQPTTRRAG